MGLEKKAGSPIRMEMDEQVTCMKQLVTVHVDLLVLHYTGSSLEELKKVICTAVHCSNNSKQVWESYSFTYQKL